MPAIYMLRRRGGLAGMPAGRVWSTRFAFLKAVGAQIALSYTFLGTSLAVIRGCVAHLSNRPLVFSETNADDIGRQSRRAHLLEPAMRRAARDALALLTLCAGLAVWRIYLDPTYGVGKEAVDWRFHLVWMMPLVVVALSPWIFHPYVVGGRDLPHRRPRPAAARVAGAPRLAPESPEWTAARRRGAA
jgi:hypothetical protein